MLTLINGLSHDPDAAGLVHAGAQLASSLEPFVQVEQRSRPQLDLEEPEATSLSAVIGTMQLLPLLLLQGPAQGGAALGSHPLSERALNRLPQILITSSRLETLTNSGGGEAMCTICQEDFVVGKKLLQLPCQHLFCIDCGQQWLRQEYVPNLQKRGAG